VSIEAAHDRYGVVLTGSVEAVDLAIDAEATRRRREQMRGEPGSAEPPRTAKKKPEVRVAVELVSGEPTKQ
jgi:hypothetical protein